MEARPKRSILVGALQIGAILAMVGVAIVFSRAPSSEDIQARQAATQIGGAPNGGPAAISVRVFHPEPSSNSLQIQTTGTVVVRNHIDLVTQVTGRVAAVDDALRAGGSFARNQHLLTIERRDFELAVAQASADIDSAESSLLLEQAEGDAARRNYALLHPGEEVPALVAKLPQIERAQASVAAARARARVAALDLERTRFSLPFDGRVVESSAEVGQLLTRGQAFGRAFAIDAIETEVPISPADLALLEPAVGRSAQIMTGGAVYTGTVQRVSPQLDERTRFAKLYVSLGRNSPKPGTFVSVELAGPAYADTYLLPEAAEQINGKVWIVSNQKLESLQTEILGRSAAGFVVRRFDTKEGIVIGAVPGGREGLNVSVADANHE